MDRIPPPQLDSLPMSSMLHSDFSTRPIMLEMPEGEPVNIMRLIEEHARIDRLAQKLRGLVRERRRDVGAILACLRHLSLELSGHLTYEDSFLYPMLADMSNEPARIQADAFVTEFASLREDWLLYLSEWTDECIEADWDQFAETTMALLFRLDRRVQRENKLLYPLAFREGYIQFRDLAPRIGDLG